MKICPQTGVVIPDNEARLNKIAAEGRVFDEVKPKGVILVQHKGKMIPLENYIRLTEGGELTDGRNE